MSDERNCDHCKTWRAKYESVLAELVSAREALEEIRDYPLSDAADIARRFLSSAGAGAK